MKSLLLTALLSTGVAHTGAFFSVWELSYVSNHVTYEDMTRKLNKLTKWTEKMNSLRDRRDKAAKDNYALYDNQLKDRDSKVRTVTKESPRGNYHTPAKMKTRSVTQR